MPVVKDIVTLITGASSGIGEAVARTLVQAGGSVLLVARREDRLKALVGELGDRAAFHTADVTDLSALQAAAALAVSRFGRLDALVNNAGVMPVTRLDALDVPTWYTILDTNIKGVLHGIAAVLPHMLSQGRGHVVNLGSVASLVVVPNNVVYCAAKHAVRVISEGLRIELTGKVRVTEINPGAVATELIEATNSGESLRRLRERFRNAMPPAAVAAAIRFALEQPEDVAVNEITIRPAVQEL